MRTESRLAREETGQVAVLVAIMFLGLVFAVALVVNTGILFVERRAAQEAADAAALAGALHLHATKNEDAARSTATQAATLNGFSTITVNIPPASGSYTKDDKYVEVIISSTKNSLLAQWGSTIVNVRAVAGGGGKPAQAIYSLGKSGIGLLVQSNGVLGLYGENAPIGCAYEPTSPTTGAPWVTAPGINPPQKDCSTYGGSAQVDTSADPAARNLGAGGTVGPPSASTTVVGSDSTCFTGTFPQITCQNPYIADPFAPVPKPRGAPGDNWCRQDEDNNAPLTTCATYTGNVSGCATSWILQPGLYTGKISGNCDYILKPGIYIFAAGSNGGIANPSKVRVLGNIPGDTFEAVPGVPGPPGLLPYVRDQNWTPCGADAPSGSPLCGVLLFFTYADYPTPPTGSGSCAEFSISGGTSADLAPEPSGLWQGMLVYYDNHRYCAGASIVVGGGAQLNGTSFRGLIYAPTASLTVNGNLSGAILSQIVVNDISVGNGTVIVNVASAQVRATGGIRLVE